jgi:uncharacterized protein YhfF
MEPTFGYPGDGGLGDRLLASVLRGEKTATSSLARGYHGRVPKVGDRFDLIDSGGRRHGSIELTESFVVPFDEVDLRVARAEGEEFGSIEDWRRAHRVFWGGLEEELRRDFGEPDWQLTGEELVVVTFFRLVEVEHQPLHG